MRRDDAVTDPAAQARACREQLAAHRQRMGQHQARLDGLNDRIAKAQTAAVDDVQLARARLEDLQQRRREALGAEYVSGKRSDPEQLDREIETAQRALRDAQAQAERAAAGAEVLTKLRDEAAVEADTEGKKGRPLEHGLEVALANAEMVALIPEFRALADRLARIRVRAERINRVADPERGLARCGVPLMGATLTLDLPNPLPAGAPDPRAFSIPMQRLVEQFEREIASAV